MTSSYNKVMLGGDEVTIIYEKHPVKITKLILDDSEISIYGNHLRELSHLVELGSEACQKYFLENDHLNIEKYKPVEKD